MRNLIIGLLALVLLVLMIGCESQSPLAPDYSEDIVQDESVTETTSTTQVTGIDQETMTKRDKDRLPLKTTD